MGWNAGSQLKRVVVTGLGLVTPLGIGVEQNWMRLMKGETAVRALQEEDLSDAHRKCMHSFTSRVVACVPKKELEDCDWRPKNDSRRILPFIDYADTAAAEALLDSRLMDLAGFDKSQIGVSVGVGMSGSGEIASTWDLMVSNSPRKISPFLVSKILPNMASGTISVRYGFQGPNLSSSTACAAGANAIGDAFNLIKMNQVQIMIAGGSESCIDAIAFLGFGKMKALSTTYNHSPSKASRPFDSGRDGFVIGEGAGVMILESLDHAIYRKAPIYAEVVGYGLSGDGHHITHPHPEGQGAFQSMSYAIRNAGLTTRDISYINAHATSTPVGDVIELEAIHRLFGESTRNHELFVSSTKGAIGHLLGAAGAVEAVYTVLSISRKVAPGTMNLENPELDSRCLIRGKKQDLDNNTTALSNSFGFGGTNTSLLLKNFNPN